MELAQALTAWERISVSSSCGPVGPQSLSLLPQDQHYTVCSRYAFQCSPVSEPPHG